MCGVGHAVRELPLGRGAEELALRKSEVIPGTLEPSSYAASHVERSVSGVLDVRRWKH